MGLFGVSNDVIIEEVEKATTEKNVEEDWGLIMSICDKAGQSSDEAKNYLKAITKRLYNPDPHIAMKAVILLDACVKNSGKTFHIEVASRDFENDFTKLMTKAHLSVAKKLRESLKKWAENEFKSDLQLNLIPSLYSKLKNTYDFSTESLVKKTTPMSKDPNVVESEKEEEQILKAIELSLKESGSPRNTASSSHAASSLYPSMNLATTSAPAKEPRKVRALYDFEAAEDNELTFTAGEVIVVTEDSDPNWWKGSNHRGEGLFPANFVTSDLSVEPEKFLYEKAKKMVQFKETADLNEVKDEPEDVEINEEKIIRLLHLLHEADPTNPEKDTDEMINLEKEVNMMGPLIDNELERVDRKHAQLTQLSSDLVEALSLYHTLMREPQFAPVNKMPWYPPSSQMPYNGSLPLNMPMPLGHERPQLVPHGGPPPSMPPQQTMPGMPYQPMPGQIPSQMQMHMPPQAEQAMGQFRPGMPANYGPPGVGPVPYPSGPIQQTNSQNGSAPQQGPNFTPSSSHLTH